MQKILLSFTFMFFSVVGLQAQTIIEEDFNSSGSSLPANWTSDPSGLWTVGAPNTIIPNAQNLLRADISAPGYESVAGVNGNSNANNAILSSPSFDLGASVTGAFVSFDLTYFGVRYTATPSLRETATLLYTTNGGSTWNTLQTLDASGTIWNSNTLSLSSLAGESNIQLGFRYENVDTVLVGMGIDNFKVFVPPANEMALESVSPVQGDINAYGEVNTDISISGVVRNNGSTAITSYTVFYQEGNNTPVSVQQSASIAPFETGSFDNINYTIPSEGGQSLKVWVELSGDTVSSNDSATAYVEGVGFLPKKRILFEEATGTWCQWCPRGTYNMLKFKEDYPDAATQVAVHNADPMTVTSYDLFIRSLPGFSGFPSMAVDRRIIVDPGNIEATYLEYKDGFGFADISLDEPNITGNQASIDVDIRPAVDIDNAKLVLIVTEDSVTGTGQGWGQVNAYAGGRNGPMGGYENKPSLILDEVYDFVGRATSPSPGGGASGLPSTLSKGQNYTATLDVTLDSEWDEKHLSYVVALIDENGFALNSNHYLSVTGLDDKNLGLTNASIYPNPASDNVVYLAVAAENNLTGDITVRDITGRIVSTIPSVKLNTGRNKVEIPTSSLSNGVYMISFQSEEGILNLKLQVSK